MTDNELIQKKKKRILSHDTLFRATRSQVPQKDIADKIDAIIQHELVTFQVDLRPRKIVNNLAELLE